MECCFAVRKKNKPPVKEYQPYDSSKIQVMVEKEENDIVAINSEIEKKSKLNNFANTFSFKGELEVELTPQGTLAERIR
jgi:acyl CoA:acetate/3-ketoacid CoA transferase alpha subunit